VTTTLYGISNCDTVKKAKRFLDEHAIDYTFHDYRKDGVDQKQVQGWIDELGWEVVLNKRGTTWRKLDEKTRDSVDEQSAAALLFEHPAMIKRPILTSDNQLLIGFKKEE